jgi:trimeric autotransporter adhesin
VNQLNFFFSIIEDAKMATTTTKFVFTKDTDVSTMSAAEISKLTVSEIASFTKAQLEQFGVTQAEGLTDKQLSVLKTGSIDSGAFVGIPLKAIPGLVIRGLSQDQINALTPAQIGTLKAGQTSALTAKQLENITAESLNALSTIKGGGFEGLNVRNISDITALDTAHVAALNVKQLNSQLTTTQINSLTAEQAAALTKVQAGIVLPKFMTALSDEAVSNLSSDFLKAAPPKTLAGLTVTGNIDALTEDQLPYITSAQINKLSSGQIDALGDNDDLQFITPAALAGLDPKNIAGLDLGKLVGDGQFDALKPAQIAKLTTLQIATIDSVSAGALTSATISAMNANQVSKLDVEKVIPNMSDTAVAGFNAKNASGITNAQMQAFSEDQVAQLTPAATAKLAAGVIDSMDASDFSYMKPESVKAITLLEVDGIPSAAFASATVDQIKAMTANQFSKLTANQLAKFGAEQAEVVSAGQLSKVTATSAGSFTAEAVAAIPSAAISKLAMSGFSSSQVAALTQEQASKLTVTQLKALGSTTGILGLNAGHVQDNNIRSFSGLSKDQVQALKYASATDAVPALSTSQIGKFTLTEAEYLKFAQAAALDADVKTWATDKKGYIMVNSSNATLTVNGTADSGFEATSSIVILGTQAAATVTGGKNDDTITVAAADTNNHTIYGGAGNDTITAGTGAESVDGGLGNDRIKIQADDLTSADIIDGNLGTDIIQIGATAGTEALAGTTAFSSVTNVETITFDVSSGNSAVTTVDALVASGMSLTVDASLLTGTLDFRASTLTGASTAAQPNLTAIEKDGAFSITGGAGADTIIGGAGNDTIDGGITGANTLLGGEGSDKITLSAAVAEVVAGGVGDDTIVVSTAITRTGADTFNVDYGTDTITGVGYGTGTTGLADILVVSSGATANVKLAGPWAAPLTVDNSGVANIDANGNTVSMALDAATSTYGYNIFNTSSTGVSMTGASKVDTITGGTGADTLIGGQGRDILMGGQGADTFTFAVANDTNFSNGEYDTVKDFLVSTDELLFTTAVPAAIDTVHNIPQDEVQAAVTALATTATDSQVATAMFAAMNDVVQVDNAVAFATFSGSTYVAFEAGGTTVDAFNATEDLFIKLEGITVLPTFLDDISSTNRASTTFQHGTTASETITPDGVATTIIGYAGDDVITGDGTAVLLVGGDGADTLTGLAGTVETLFGGNGNDTLSGIDGADVLAGGAGADTFILSDPTAAATINDFTVSQSDVLNFDISALALNAADYAAGAAVIVNVAGLTALASGGVSNHVVIDTAANLALFDNAGTEVTGTLVAIESDTGNVLFDADGDLTGATAVTIATITAAQVASISTANLFFVV